MNINSVKTALIALTVQTAQRESQTRVYSQAASATQSQLELAEAAIPSTSNIWTFMQLKKEQLAASATSSLAEQEKEIVTAELNRYLAEQVDNDR
jgi:hypothetical protein